MLQARIAAKRAELDNLRQLRDLSGNLASQLAGLEAKLSTLRDGAQSVALVLANWQNVLRAINMAASTFPPSHSSLFPLFFCRIDLRFSSFLLSLRLTRWVEIK